MPARDDIENTPMRCAEMPLPPDTPITIALVAERVTAGTVTQCADRIHDYLDAGAWPEALYNPDPNPFLERLIQH